MKVYLLQNEHSEYDNMYQTISADSDKPLIFSSKESAQKWIIKNWIPRFGNLFPLNIIETTIQED